MINHKSWAYGRPHIIQINSANRRKTRARIGKAIAGLGIKVTGVVVVVVVALVLVVDLTRGLVINVRDTVVLGANVVVVARSIVVAFVDVVLVSVGIVVCAKATVDTKTVSARIINTSDFNITITSLFLRLLVCFTFRA